MTSDGPTKEFSTDQIIGRLTGALSCDCGSDAGATKDPTSPLLW